jgi:hypothetical protein
MDEKRTWRDIALDWEKDYDELEAKLVSHHMKGTCSECRTRKR